MENNGIVRDHGIQLPLNNNIEKIESTSLQQGVENVRNTTKLSIMNHLKSITLAEMIIIEYPDVFEEGRQKCLTENIEDEEIYPWLVDSILNLLSKNSSDLELPRDIDIIKKAFLRKCTNMCLVRRGDAAGAI